MMSAKKKYDTLVSFFLPENNCLNIVLCGFVSDEATICKPENIKHGLVAHPYNCSMYVDCTGSKPEEKYVYNYMKGNVYDPENGWSVRSIECAAPIGKQKH